MIPRAVLALLFWTLALSAWNQEEQPNVNSRYVVESVHLIGTKIGRLPASTRREMEQVVGQKLDHSMLDKLAGRIKSELRVEKVAIHVAKGTEADHVTVEFVAESGRRQDFDIDIQKGVYNAKQGWSGAVNVTASLFGDRQDRLTLGVVNDGDGLVERFSGIHSRLERESVGSDRIRAGVSFDTYHQQWNSSTQAALGGNSAALYRSRMSIEPSLTFVIAKPLTLTVGVSVDRLESQTAAAGTHFSNSFTNTLRLHEGWEDGEANTHELDAGYSLRAATTMLASDFGYTRHAATLAYRIKHGRQSLAARFLAGRVGGHAPLFERFVLGNASTLRGWNKFALDPIGGDHVVHTSVDYSYRILQVFYDTGAVWTAPAKAERKQSVGAGVGRAGKDGFLLAVAFPLRSGHIEPMLIAGFNF